MNETATISAFDLANVYAKYFVEDGALTIVQNLGGTYPVDPDTIKAYIENAVALRMQEGGITAISGVNTITRFLFECANYALENAYPDMASEAAYDTIKGLPSIHHAELGAIYFALSDLYRKTLERTLLGVVMRDANTATKAIAQAVQDRTSITETGGSILHFNWGILGDGLWLNAALLRAFDLAMIFRSGEQVVSYYTEIAFRFAIQHASFTAMEREDEAHANGELGVLATNLTDPSIADFINEFGLENLGDFLFAPGAMIRYVRTWENGLTYANQIVPTIQELSILARILAELINTLRTTLDLMGDEAANRIIKAYDVVTLVLAGYEALRETKFGEALIIDVITEGEDPKVSVVVNDDLINAYRATGNQDSDLVQFGLYLDPRKGIPVSNNGWSLSYVLQRRDDIVPQMMAEDSDRLERLRSNDGTVILNESLRIINDVVRSYLESSKMTDLRPDIYQRVNGAARAIIDPQSTMQIDQEITSILLMIIDDAFLTKAFDKLMQLSMAAEGEDKQNVKAMVIASLAVDDLFDFIATEENEAI